MRGWALAAAVALCAQGCARPARESSAVLLDRARVALAERDRKLPAYRFLATSTRGGERAVHRFAFRAPNQSHGELLEPRHLVRAFDGRRLVELDYGLRLHTTFEVTLPPAKAAHLLASTFGPMVPEGLRAPLLPAKGLQARLLPASERGELLEVTATATDEAGAEVRTAWVFRWPELDLQAKRVEAAGQRREMKVEEERCEAARGLCVPVRTTDWLDGRLEGSMALTEVELADDLPAEQFAPVAPPGWESLQRKLVDAPGQP